MAPRPVTWNLLNLFEENFDLTTGAFRYTIFTFIDEDDIAYFGTLNHRKHDITLEQLTFALIPISDQYLFPEWSPRNEQLTRAPDALPPNIYIKRPDLALYGLFQHKILHLIHQGLFEEVKGMEMLAQHPHPNIIHHYDCRVKSVDKTPFMEALESAIRHIHSLNWAQNDLNPGNILVNVETGMPIPIDFGSARRISTKLATSRGTKGWIDSDMKDYHTSDYRHDLSALEKIRTWFDTPTFGD
ncbi:hypothetical protein BDU57DRAFT_539169 [Ampelomyces quisqualis]|uniref:Protein kinase domain-containing protein n=1 Tax=Ampelomyces quisqualis TaxID=50730 RepID=A0A6A5QQ44_AMPQU|nr:hypothetical protein BDU57DRAFT_539169 [Ampelomyces quisqualis]